MRENGVSRSLSPPPARPCLSLPAGAAPKGSADGAQGAGGGGGGGGGHSIALKYRSLRQVQKNSMERPAEENITRSARPIRFS